MYAEYLKTIKNLFPEGYAEMVINGYDKMGLENEITLKDWDVVIQDDIIVYVTGMMLIQEEIVRKGATIDVIEKTFNILNEQAYIEFVNHYANLIKILEKREHFEQCKHLQEITIKRMSELFELQPDKVNKELTAYLQ